MPCIIKLTKPNKLLNYVAKDRHSNKEPNANSKTTYITYLSLRYSCNASLLMFFFWKDLQCFYMQWYRTCQTLRVFLTFHIWIVPEPSGHCALFVCIGWDPGRMIHGPHLSYWVPYRSGWLRCRRWPWPGNNRAVITNRYIVAVLYWELLAVGPDGGGAWQGDARTTQCLHHCTNST